MSLGSSLSLLAGESRCSSSVLGAQGSLLPDRGSVLTGVQRSLAPEPAPELDKSGRHPGVHGEFCCSYGCAGCMDCTGCSGSTIGVLIGFAGSTLLVNF